MSWPRYASVSSKEPLSIVTGNTAFCNRIASFRKYYSTKIPKPRHIFIAFSYFLKNNSLKPRLPRCRNPIAKRCNAAFGHQEYTPSDFPIHLLMHCLNDSDFCIRCPVIVKSSQCHSLFLHKDIALVSVSQFHQIPRYPSTFTPPSLIPPPTLAERH